MTATYMAIDPWVLWDVAAGDQEVFRTLAWIYLDQAPALARRMHEGQLQNAHAEVRAASHTLKGMAGLLGATELCAVLEELEAAASDARKSQIRGMDRSERIRTYNFPENRIADHRTGYKAYNLDQVMNGALDPVIDSAIHADEEAQLAALGEE